MSDIDIYLKAEFEAQLKEEAKLNNKVNEDLTKVKLP